MPGPISIYFLTKISPETIQIDLLTLKTLILFPEHCENVFSTFFIFS